MSEVEYDAIEAAVAETARGRRFLAEFARRNRVAETRQLLDAMTRLEAAVGRGASAAPSASMRLLAQRANEIAQRLGDVADEMRAGGGDDHLADAIETQARAVAGIVRAATPTPARQPPTLEPASSQPVPLRLPPALSPPVRASSAVSSASASDPRVAALAPLDALTIHEKLALFR